MLSKRKVRDGETGMTLMREMQGAGFRDCVKYIYIERNNRLFITRMMSVHKLE